MRSIGKEVADGDGADVGVDDADAPGMSMVAEVGNGVDEPIDVEDNAEETAAAVRVGEEE
jgi:hypothetical protein